MSYADTVSHNAWIYLQSKHETPDELARAFNHGKTWRKEDLDLLKDMVMNRVSITTIKSNLGRTRLSVQAQCLGLGLARITTEGKFKFNPVDPTSTTVSDDEMNYTEVKPKEETAAMTKLIETKIFILGVDVSSNQLTDDVIFNALADAERKIKELETIENRPKRLQRRIEELRGEIKALVEYLDSKEE